MSNGTGLHRILEPKCCFNDPLTLQLLLVLFDEVINGSSGGKGRRPLTFSDSSSDICPSVY